MTKVHIDEVCPKGAVYPLIVNFQNGYTTDEFTSKNCEVFQQNSGGKTIATEICDLLYSGTEQTEDFGHTMILARNKTTGKVRLIEVGCAELKPVLKNNLDSVTLDTSSLELSRKFGSKKQKKMMEQREKFKVNKQTVSDQMHNVTVNIAEDQLDLSSYLKADSDNFYIPPINRSATKVTEVYDIYKILTKEQYDKIYSEIEEKDYTADMVPWLSSVVSSKNMSKEHTVLALFANCLYKLYTTMTKEISKKMFVVCPHSVTLNDIILNNFTSMSNNRRNRSLQLKDKSLCHMIVFLLIIHDFRYNAEELSKHVKIAVKTLATKVNMFIFWACILTHSLP